MSKLRLWGHQKSINVQKVLWKRPETKAVLAWYARISERPGFQRWIDLPLW
jgi:hypothetical protein